MYGFEINQLANLLKQSDPNRDDSDSDDDQPKKNATAHFTPASFISQAQKTAKTIENVNAETLKKPSTVNSKDIWQIDEVPDNNIQIQDQVDKRPQPEYEMHYKQRITTEDVFLQMGNKNPSSASCEDLMVNIQLPNTKLSDIILDIKKSFLDCRCPKYRLALSLPHPVDPDNSQAKWDKDKCLLQVTLKLVREYDDFNF
ncbi:unnamed protein product [Rotaria sordida]|uniref:PIH1D1/2/3 CS-like domain-containing protein n=1 Tax=Rotaria sordida TaxID=392033 RepID=A0A813URA0_9BILA|nr:unnamed protein product [Rotaria sordida]CAF1018961.1 unnamed protein product [Rotaria sordida]